MTFRFCTAGNIRLFQRQRAKTESGSAGFADDIVVSGADDAEVFSGCYHTDLSRRQLYDSYSGS